ncbi:penicillin-binding protein 1C [Tamlana sp. I1]|uniref:penicillin-binding protein 1C n=1 Tax=Tamlana sp. I1 TaxID=2762061 RepID=UPI001E312BE5
MLNKLINLISRNKIKSVVILILFVLYTQCLPTELFNTPTSTVIESKEGVLLGALIAKDGQWRFPISDTIPNKIKQCVLNFEDAYFYKHPGFNPVSIFKALKSNITNGSVVRGGSTITQQVIRLSRQGHARTYYQKLIELVLATRLEIRASKETILKTYLANAPFGGNVVGLDAASWRYFGIAPSQLTWAESATLGVLPNAPSLIYPGKNQKKLLEKRNRLLKKLYENAIIDSLTFQLALQEKLPQKPFPLPNSAPHLLQEIAKNKSGQRVTTSINHQIQRRANRIVKKHYNNQKQNAVNNMAVLILDVNTKKVLSYIGNSPTTKTHQKDVNIINAPRSTGSVLKPFLYMGMLDKGKILPNTLVADVPTTISNYKPENFNLQYTGAVSARKALARSLNIPAVRMLNHYGVESFYDELQKLNLKQLNKGSDHYGLSVILGGGESCLWDLCNAYGSLAGTVNNYLEHSAQYNTQEFAPFSYYKEEKIKKGSLTQEKNIYDAGSIYLGFEAMTEVERPEEDSAWEYYNSSQKIAWKTGTSFGGRDAWAIGVTKDYVVGVWLGNADGEGRPNLTGVSSAGPVLFDLFNILPKSSWFQKPYDALVEVDVCTKSGYLANPLCDKTKQYISSVGLRTKACPFHTLVHLDETNRYRVHASCESLDAINSESWFILPPLMAWYYKKQDATYKNMPPLRSDCKGETLANMDFIFPEPHASIILPKNFDGEINKVVFKLAHSRANTKVFWYLNEEFLKTTEVFHQIDIKPQTTGEHTITVVDAFGNELKRTIYVKRE